MAFGYPYIALYFCADHLHSRKFPSKSNTATLEIIVADEDRTHNLELTAHIVAAYVEKNSMPVAGLSDLIASVSASIAGLSGQPAAPAETLTPAVNPKKSVFPDYIVSLEDGKQFKSLKRALMSRYGLTPDQYRAKWNLPRDYPMVAPNYAASRSALAKKLGLGRKPASASASAAPKQQATTGAKRGRPKKKAS